jgi:peptidoglycan/xylan/chitin deacetylase (PgdA/CDA1 family)
VSDHRWICLMYHEVTPEAVRSGAGEWFSVSAGSFASQLDQIRGRGLRGCSVADVLASGQSVDPVVAISFDDGSEGQYARAFPALVARGMSATFFVTTSWVGRPGFVTWPQLREMKQAGMSIQSHTHSHPFLSELAPPALEQELRRSKAELDHQLGQNTDQLSLPGGDYPRRRFRGLIGQSGYRVLCTSVWGRNRRRVVVGAPVKRCTIRGAMAPEEFDRIILGDPWLGLTRGLRGNALNMVRSSLGPTRYSRWRRSFLDAAR